MVELTSIKEKCSTIQNKRKEKRERKWEKKEKKKQKVRKRFSFLSSFSSLCFRSMSDGLFVFFFFLLLVPGVLGIVRVVPSTIGMEQRSRNANLSRRELSDWNYLSLSIPTIDGRKGLKFLSTEILLSFINPS